jgi:hypothetical protein
MSNHIMNITTSGNAGNKRDTAMIAVIIAFGSLFLFMFCVCVKVNWSKIKEWFEPLFEPCQGEMLEENLKILKMIGHFLASPCTACIEDIHNNAPPENRVVAQYKLVI